MTRQEELVWAAAWVDALRTGGPRHEAIKEAQRKAAWAIDHLRERAEESEVLASDDPPDILLRQMAGEPECFIRQRPPSQQGGVYIGCQHPQIETADHCQRCVAFGGWPKEEEP